MVHSYIDLKVQALDYMTVSGFRVRVTGLVLVFKSASLVLKQVPTQIRKPKTNNFDKSVVLEGFRSFYMALGRLRSFFRLFQVVLDRFSLLQLVPHFSKYLVYRYSSKQVLLKVSQESTCVGVSSKKACTLMACNLVKKSLKNWCFSPKFQKFLRTTFFYRSPQNSSGDCFCTSGGCFCIFFQKSN